MRKPLAALALAAVFGCFRIGSKAIIESRWEIE
jgi:hypothetical protein